MTTLRYILAAMLCLLAALPLTAQTPATRPLSGAEEVELKTFVGQLSDATRDPKTKLDAATLLLSRTYYQAALALKDFLLDNNNRPAQVAVAEAIARAGSDQSIFIDPLLAMLTGTEATVRDPAGRALAAYKSAGVTAKLIELAADKKRDKAIRLVSITSLQRVLDKSVVDALVTLLDDSDATVRQAAADALVQLTNIRAFGNNRYKWKEWWRQNMNKDRSQWLADLADSLGQAKTALEAENSKLRTRLAKSMMDLYAETPAGQRDARLMSFLKDPLLDVRLVGLDLLNRNLAGGTAVAPELRAQVRGMLADEDSRVRQESAKLLAALGDNEAMKILLERLKVETLPPVRASILMALGQLRDATALPTIIEEIQSKQDEEAAAAAGALGKIAAKQPLDEETLKSAVKALSGRYPQATGTGGDPAVREALLAAMGTVGDKSFVPILDEALKDEAATVRLAAVTSLAQMNSTASAGAIEKLVGDTADRGVRRAAITALKTLGGEKYLTLILSRTDPSAEDDAANRQQAWDLAMDILAKSEAKVLADVAEKLANRSDAAAHRIKVLQMLAASLEEANSSDLPLVLRQLGGALARSTRYAEAATCLSKSCELLKTAKSPAADDVWQEWVAALLGNDDPAAIKAMASQSNIEQFSKALGALDARLGDLKKAENWSAMCLLAGECTKQLPSRLSDAQNSSYADMFNQAKTQQLAADRQKVAKLAATLASGDAASQKTAAAELTAMGDRAVGPLLAELKSLVEAEKSNLPAEQALADVLKQLAPKLAGYDVSAAKDQRLKLISMWMKTVNG